MAFVKDMLRMWAHSWKRFISIAMITLLERTTGWGRAPRHFRGLP